MRSSSDESDVVDAVEAVELRERWDGWFGWLSGRLPLMAAAGANGGSPVGDNGEGRLEPLFEREGARGPMGRAGMART
jgi:hypothetical protein